jgi:hypothetical protein
VAAETNPPSSSSGGDDDDEEEEVEDDEEEVEEVEEDPIAAQDEPNLEADVGPEFEGFGLAAELTLPPDIEDTVTEGRGVGWR